MEETKLTPTERGAQALQMAEHKRAKCHRCCARLDLSDGGYVCERGLVPEVQMTMAGKCPKFVFDDDPENWLS